MHFSRGYGNTFLRDEDDDDQVSLRNIFRVEEKIRANVGKAQIGCVRLKNQRIVCLRPQTAFGLTGEAGTGSPHRV